MRERFAALKTRSRKALVAFLTAGDPDAQATVPALHTLVANGADVLEVGVPFSDPEAEGPAIQAASERALANGITLASVLSMVQQFREQDTDTPIVLMGYLNSVLAMGESGFAEAASAAGVDGVILVNLPPEEAASLQQALAAVGIDLILLVAPTTTRVRRQMIADSCSGFLYYVSLKGPTGSGHMDPEDVKRNVSELKQMTQLPICIGFGIKDGATAAAVAQGADGVVVGSALVATMGDAQLTLDQKLARLAEQVQDIRSGLE
ncbi:UNVERIFIED_CONTAM: hypothetical protein GTU68_048553 [Idotea baltica]|nr:hypothetical protein [Idotea baltica]